MERFLLLLDDLEDAIYALALLSEKMRRIILTTLALLASLTGQAAAILVALSQPAMGLAIAALLAVAVLYRSATLGLAAAPRTASG